MLLWDEARIAVSAFEMTHNHNLLVVHYAGRPDMWSVKPPLMIWLQALGISIWGMHEWVTRLPGAIASTGTCMIIYWFFARRKEPLLGFIAALALITSQGFMTLHCSRTGDYDTLLTCFCTAYCLSYFSYIEGRETKYLYTTFIFLTLAALTKGVAALLFLPALLLFTLYRKKLVPLLRTKHFYTGLVGFIVLVFGYYLLRDHYNPGYIKAVQDNELGGRYTQALEHNKGVFLYYFNNMKLYQFTPWYLLIIPGALAGILAEGGKHRHLTVYLLLLSITFFLVISSAQTKLYWYAMPMYPFLSVIVALLIYFICAGLQFGQAVQKVLICCMLFLIFFWPYKKILPISISLPRMGAQGWENYHMAEYLQLLSNNGNSMKGTNLFYTDYNANILWYQYALSCQNRSEQQGPEVNENIIVFQDSVKKYVETHYQTTILQTYYNVIVYRVNGKQ